MSRKPPLDPCTTRWFMRRIRAKERAHREDARLSASYGDKEGEERARDTALSFGIFGDLIQHEARAIERKHPRLTPATPRESKAKPAKRKR